MSQVNIKRTIDGNLDQTIAKLTEELKKEGFGILTRIDLHQKFAEKLGKSIPATVVLGACDPKLAYEVYSKHSDFASLLPCNAVVRDLGNNKLSVELASPKAMIQFLGDESLKPIAERAEKSFHRVLEAL